MTAAIAIPTNARTANYPPQMGVLLGALAAAMALITCDEFTNPENVTTNALKTTVASSATAVSYSGTALNGAIGATALKYPRNATVTTSGATATNAPATVTFTGLDVDGNVQTETISGVNGGAATYSGVKTFASFTNISAPGGAGTAANLVFGIGPILGLLKQVRSRAGGTVPVREISAGSLVTSGAMASAVTSVPNGSYTPAAAPNGSTSYAVYYEAATS